MLVKFKMPKKLMSHLVNEKADILNSLNVATLRKFYPVFSENIASVEKDDELDAKIKLTILV